MNKYFVCSDIHSYYDELIAALDAAGFDKNNPNHYFLSCGDELDRGPKPKEVIDYLMSLERKILIRGNHTSLFEEMCQRGYPMIHDLSNGTLDTYKQLGYDSFAAALEGTAPLRNQMVNYFETDNYIFVHSWIPDWCGDWRKASQEDWDAASWTKPFNQIRRKNFLDKTIVFGHWHCSAAWALEKGLPEFGPLANFDPYFGEKYIAIDACTAYSGKVNVIVIED